VAAPPIAAHPGRTLVAFLVVLLAFGGLMFALDRTPTPGLGLDLEGGTSITLTAETTDDSEVTPEALTTAVNIIRSRVESIGVSESETTTQGNNTIVVAVPGVGEDELVELVGTTAELRFRQVCNIAAGTNPPVPTTTPTPTGSEAPTPSVSPDAAPGATTTGGTTEPAPATPSGSADSTTTPAQTDTPAAFGRFGTSAGNLQNVRLVASTTTAPGATTPVTSAPATTAPEPTTLAPTTPGATTPAADPTPGTTEPATPDTGCAGALGNSDVQTSFAELDCADPENLRGVTDRPEDPIAACEEDGSRKYILAPATVLGTDVEDAAAGIPQGGVAWQVNLTFTGDGATKFTRMSELLFGAPTPTDQFGIVLDGVVQSAPVMQGRIPGNTAQITGDFTQVEAQQLANVLKYGALPLAFTTSDVSEVTPTLGSASLRAGLIAGLIGLGLVLVYAMVYYRALGFVVVASLAVAGATTYVAVVLLSEWIGFTLTLSGVAGLIVAIGITADSFIIYFERVRDEIREGRTLRAAVEHGWGRARRTIISADFVSLLSALVLYIVSIGNVRGFAFALGLSTVIDLLVVFFFTKPLMSFLAGNPRLASGSSRWSGLAGDRLGAPARTKGATTRRTPGAPIAEES